MTQPTWLSEIEARLWAATHVCYTRGDIPNPGNRQIVNCAAREDIARLIEALKESEAKLRVATEALEYYSTPTYYQVGTLVECRGGDKAREALASLRSSDARIQSIHSEDKAK